MKEEKKDLAKMETNNGFEVFLFFLWVDGARRTVGGARGGIGTKPKKKGRAQIRRIADEKWWGCGVDEKSK